MLPSFPQRSDTHSLPHFRQAKYYFGHVPLLVGGNTDLAVAEGVVACTCDMLQVDVEVKDAAVCDNGQQVWRVQSRIDGCAETSVQCPNEGTVVVDIEAIEPLAANVEVVEVALSTICSEENATLVSPRNRHLKLVDKIGKAVGAGRAIVVVPGLRHDKVIGTVNKLAAADIVIYTPVVAIV